MVELLCAQSCGDDEGRPLEIDFSGVGLKSLQAASFKRRGRER